MDKADDKAKPESSDSSTSEEKFKKGDYSVHLFIEESKGLLPVTDDKNFNPVITVKCFEKMKCTRKLKDVTSGATSLWNEHLYFSKLGCTVDSLESEKILIEVKDSRTLKDSLIGSYELDFTYVYFQPKHTILHQWIFLSNPYCEDVSVQRGLVKIGVSVLHESDKSEDLTAKGTGDTLLIPPQINVKSMQLIIQILKGINLPKMDSSGTCDAYCVATFGTISTKTKVITADKATMSADWFSELWLPVCQPSITNKISISIWDHDAIGDDELIGSLSFNWNKLGDEASSKFQWSNIYGAPDNITNDAAKEMNSNDKGASNWRGRILVKMFKVETEKALVKQLSIDTEENRSLLQELDSGADYRICAQVLEGVNLPDRTGTYAIAVRFAEAITATKTASASSGCCRWYEAPKSASVSIPDGSIMPDVFVYLMCDGKPICFARMKYHDYCEARPEHKWVRFTPDKVIGKVSNPWEGGYVLMKLAILAVDQPGYDKKFWEVKAEAAQARITKKLVCNLYQCKDLPASDPTGLADPYVKVLCGGSEVSTDKKAKLEILNPLWYETFSMDISMCSVETAPPIIVQVWDYDAGSSDDVMGLCIIDVSTVPVNPSDAPRPTWYKLNLGTKDTEEGEILMSFMIIDSKPPPFFMPNLTEINIEIYALGFRNLKPALGWLPVNKAFFKINVGSIQLPGEQTLVSEISTQPNNPGPNPNIGAVLTFKTKIPIDPLYCPNLTCTVYDYLMSGKSQPILGNFTLDLHKVYSLRQKAQKILEHGLPKFIKKLQEEEAKVVEAVEEVLKIEETPQDDNHSEDQPLVAAKSKVTVVPEVTVVKRESFAVLPLSLSEAQQSGVIVVMPQFKDTVDSKKQIEVKFKDSHYIPIGYNRSPKDDKKHYRYVLDSAFEKSPLFGAPPFERFPIKKGQIRGVEQSIFSFGKKTTDPDELSTLTEAGVFKGLVRMSNANKAQTSGEEEDGFERIAKLLLVKNECVVRVYVINAFDLEQKDLDSASYPYLVIKLGKQKISDKDNVFMDNPNPKFLKHFDLPATFPGESTLAVQVWDHDDLFSDDKIGTTKIDLEDRFFNETWKSIADKPIEIRKLRIKSCKQSQGSIRLWVEIHPSNNIPPPWDLSPKPPEKLEMRLIIWKCEDVPNQDIEGVSDLYVVANLNDTGKKETDTHYRAQSGKASWNWRMKFNLLADEDFKCILNLSLWDRDLLSSNDAIGDACIELTDLVQQALETGEKVKRYGKSENLSDRALRRENEKFFVDFKTRDQNGVESYVGKVLISIEILPDLKALACINAEGRSEPNIEPQLPAPEGRIQLTLNPFKMLSQMVGPELKRKICCYFCIALCCFLFCMMFPMIVSNVFANIIS